MTLVVCLDEKGGMLFGGKRQSRDRRLMEELCSLARSARIVVTPYSRALFPEDAPVQVTDHPETAAGKGDFYFVEDGALPEGGVSRLVIYRWNRRYPGTRFFDPAPWKGKLIQSRDFAGSSHEKITEEIYEVMA